MLAAIEGVELVLPGEARPPNAIIWMASRIGDLIVLGDKDTVFGDLDTPSERLPAEYRAHGSLHEMDVPLVIHNAQAKLAAADLHHNWELSRWLYPA